MGQTRHKTTIEIGVDDREVAGLEKSLGRAFDQRRLDQFAKTLERIAETMERISGGANNFSGSGFGGGNVRGGGGGGTSDLVRAIMDLKSSMDTSNKESKEARKKGLGGFAQTMFGTAAGQALYGGARGVMGAGSRMGAAAASGNFIQQALSIIPVAGPVLGAAAQSSMQLYREHAQQQMAQSSAYGATGVGRGMGRMVRQGVYGYGLSPGQVPGMAAQFAQQSALTGGALQGAFGTQLAMSQLMGVHGAGGVVQAAGIGGGSVSDPSKLMKEAMGSGIVAGIRDTRLDQYLAGLSGYMEDIRSKGIQLDPASAITLMTAFQMTGQSFKGEAGTRFAQNFGQAFGQAGRGRGMAHGLALRAAGFGSGTSYQAALEKIEQRDPATMQAFVDSLRSQTSDTDAGAYLMRTAMEELGVDMSAVNARELFEKGMHVDPEGEMAVAGMRGVERLQERSHNARGIFGAGATLGSVQLTRQRLGGDPNVGGVGRGLMLRELEIMGQVLPRVTPSLGKIVDLAADVLGNGPTSRAVGDLADQAQADLPSMIQSVAMGTFVVDQYSRAARRAHAIANLNKDPASAVPPAATTTGPTSATGASTGGAAAAGAGAGGAASGGAAGAVGPVSSRSQSLRQAGQSLAIAALLLNQAADADEAAAGSVSAVT